MRPCTRCRWFLLALLVLFILGCPSPTGDDLDTTPPGPVADLTATAGAGEVLLSWIDPEDGDLDHIEISWSPGDADPVSVDPGEEEYLITGLTNGTPYTFDLVSVDGAGNRSDVADVSVTPAAGTTTDTGDTDTTDDTTDSEWSIGDIGSDISWTEDTAPELSWDATSRAGSYEIQLAAADAAIETGRILDAPSPTLQIEESLGNSVEHRWRVRGVDGTRRSNWSETYALGVAWDEEITDIAARNEDVITIHWNDLAGAVGYEIQVTRNEEYLENALIRAVEDSQYVYDGTLSDGQELYWRIRAVDRVGYAGAWSNSHSFSISTVVAPRDGLVAEYLLNGTGVDTSTTGLDATIRGNPSSVFDRHGNAGGAMSFDGVDDALVGTARNINRHFTISGWVQADSEADDVIYAEKSSWSSTGSTLRDRVYLMRRETGEILFYIRTKSGAWNDYDGYVVETNAVFTSGWTHVAAIRNDSELLIYVNGQNQSTSVRDYARNANTYDLRDPMDNESGIAIRRGVDFSESTLDDIRVYDRVLTSEEVLALYGDGGSNPDVAAGNQDGGDTSPSIVPRDGLVGEYLFGGDAQDTSGNSNDGTVYGATLVRDRFNQSASAYSFDGVDDYIDLGQATELQIPFPISVSMFLSNDDLSQGAFVFKNASVDGYGYYYGIWISVGDGGAITASYGRGYAAPSSRRNYKTVGSGTPAEGQWYHAVFVYEDNLNTQIYINGTQQDIELGTGTATSMLYGGSYPAWIGKRNSSGSESPFNGRIDDFRIYDRVLSEVEIESLFREGGWNGSN